MHKGKRFTIIYTTTNQCGTLVHYAQIALNKNQTLPAALEKFNIDMMQVAQVFPGWQDSIESSWSEIANV